MQLSVGNDAKGSEAGNNGQNKAGVHSRGVI
jgi:hypothetical protein